jgi:hypothetical protein
MALIMRVRVRMADRRWAAIVAALAGLALLVVVVLFMSGRLGQQVATSPSPSPTATASPTPTATATATASPTATAAPTTTATPAPPTTAEEAARQLAIALETSDYDRIRALVTPNGWLAGFQQSEGTQRMTPDETIAWLRQRAPGGRIRADVSESPLIPCTSRFYPCRRFEGPDADVYMKSKWTDFETPGTQNVHLVLEKVGTTWYWSAALFRAPD